MLLKPNPPLRQERIAVSDEYDRVTLKLGNVDVTMTYATAIQLAGWLRVHGRKAKRFAGDTSRNISAYGILTDGNAGH
jgi:hypothetical protein